MNTTTEQKLLKAIEELRFSEAFEIIEANKNIFENDLPTLAGLRKEYVQGSYKSEANFAERFTIFVKAQIADARANPQTLPQPEPVLEKNTNYKETVGKTSFKMIFIEGGTFQMGNSEKENASPAHAVTLSNFFLAETPVTQALWREVMNQEGDYQPLIEANFAGENHPIVHVSWEDAQVFIQRLNERVGKETSYTLPTEAQWEYAAREGKAQTSQNISGVDDNKFPTTDYPLFAHYGQTETNWYPIAVKVKEPNSLGLYGMSGNVWDWCADVFKPNAIAYRRNAQNNLNPKVENIEGQPVLNTRVIRGGAYNSNDKGSVFLWFRFSKDASTQAKFISFRLCRNV